MSATLGRIDQRLVELGIALPPTNPAQGNYLGYQQTGNLVFIAGQGPRLEGKLIWKGVLGDSLTLEEGREAAKLCALNLIGQLREACNGDLDRVQKVVRLAGLVRCTADFEDQSKVVNAASDLICDVFGARGPHARIVTGTHALPSGMAVEIEALFEII